MISGRRLPGELRKELLHRVRTDCSKCDGYSLPDAAHQGLRQARRGGRKKTRKVAFLIDNILSLLTFIQELSDLKAHQRRETMIKGIAPSPINNPTRKLKKNYRVQNSQSKSQSKSYSDPSSHYPTFLCHRKVIRFLCTAIYSHLNLMKSLPLTR